MNNYVPYVTRNVARLFKDYQQSTFPPFSPLDRELPVVHQSWDITILKGWIARDITREHRKFMTREGGVYEILYRRVMSYYKRHGWVVRDANTVRYKWRRGEES